jgi:hypothetical protein
MVRWAVVAVGALGTYAFVLRARQLHWGATADETTAPLPGDTLIPAADLVATRAITVRADAEQVWPWLAQLGQGRGGLYSYDWLENLVGCQMDSADRVVPQWQDVAVGDDFRLHPDVALSVEQVDPPRALVIRGGVSPAGRPTTDDPAMPYDFTWAFVLVPDGPGRTRLLIRERYAYLTAVARPLVEMVSVASFVMTERMLRGVRDRAEGMGERAAQ